MVGDNIRYKQKSLARFEKEMAQWAAEPPGLTVKQIKKLVPKATNKHILGGFSKSLFYGDGFWSNGSFMLFEDVPEDVGKAYELSEPPSYSNRHVEKRESEDADKLAAMCTVPVIPAEIQWRDKWDNEQLAVMFTDGNGGRVSVPGGQLSAILARAGKNDVLTYTAQLQGGIGGGIVLVQNGHRIGLMAGLLTKAIDGEPVATFGYRGE